MCDSVIRPSEQGICCNCEKELEYVGEEYCQRCGKPVEAHREYCDDCQKKNATYESGRSVFVYNKRMKLSMERFKNQNRVEYGEFYARAMYEEYGSWIDKIQPDALIPVPIHVKRYEKRGYNQAEILANALGNLCNIPVYKDYLIRMKNTLPQKQLTNKERRNNLLNAFAIREEWLYQNVKCVIIIDDIYTTGYTIETCSQVLFQSGIEKIYFMCVCTGRGN